MIICYYCDVTLPIYNDVFLQALISAEKHMPKVPRVLMTTVAALPKFPSEIMSLLDEYYDVIFPTRPVYGYYPYRRCLAQSQLPGDVLFLDTDTIIQRDVSSVFQDKDFEIAPTRLCKECIFRVGHTHNAGVCFSRSTQFWSDLVSIIEREVDYNAVEIHYSKLCNSGWYRVKHLDDKIYNHVPGLTPGNLQDAAIVHYCSHRKQMLSDKPWDGKLISRLG
jgi:hypothetical protein